MAFRVRVHSARQSNPPVWLKERYAPGIRRVVAAGRWIPPPEERFLGLEIYGTSGAGVGGVIKRSAEDFHVEEISAYPVPDSAGPITVLRIESRDWEQHELAHALAGRLGVPAHTIRWAGTKDRRAIAERAFSYPGPLPDTADLGLPRVHILEAYRARKELVLGHHYGNRFDITVRDLDVPLTVAEERIEIVLTELRRRDGFPNLFGPQRFGEVRPITHEVGRELVRGDVGGAVETYLVASPPGETPLGKKARRAYADHHDPVRGLREFPPSLRFERQLLDRLARGHSPVRAFRSLGRPLRLLFIHAYQGYLFNRILSARVEAGLPLYSPVEGDWLLRVGPDGTVSGRGPIRVTADNGPEAQALVARGRARVAAPLVGFETPLLEGEPGRIAERILGEEGVSRDMFGLPATPDIASPGYWRSLTVPLPDIRVERVDSAVDRREISICFRFVLPKGCYATVLLREFLKRGATPAAATAIPPPSHSSLQF
jgi:tRNA pseudouridine13 synthase